MSTNKDWFFFCLLLKWSLITSQDSIVLKVCTNSTFEKIIFLLIKFKILSYGYSSNYIFKISISKK